jgi:tetratricopeptide (TPR) repeat protein
VALDEKQGPVHMNLGTAYLRQGRLDKALDELKLAVAADPDSPVIRKRLAFVLSRQKKYGAAIEQLQVALEKQPGDWECRNSLAAIYMILYLRHPQQDRLREQALEEWHQSLQENPEQPPVKDQLARWAKPGQAPALDPPVPSPDPPDRP